MGCYIQSSIEPACVLYCASQFWWTSSILGILWKCAALSEHYSEDNHFVSTFLAHHRACFRTESQANSGTCSSFHLMNALAPCTVQIAQQRQPITTIRTILQHPDVLCLVCQDCCNVCLSLGRRLLVADLFICPHKNPFRTAYHGA